MGVLVQFGCGTRILRVIHGRDARATLQTEPIPKWALSLRLTYPATGDRPYFKLSPPDNSPIIAARQ
jgi:hypothetical protein